MFGQEEEKKGRRGSRSQTPDPDGIDVSHENPSAPVRLSSIIQVSSLISSTVFAFGRGREGKGS